MENVLVLLIIAVILGSALGYIVWQKKKGVRCGGCSSASCCNKKEAPQHSLGAHNPNGSMLTKH